MEITHATLSDYETLVNSDKHISKAELRNLILSKRVLIAKQDGDLRGWLRYNLFWDNIPFMNMLYVINGYRSMRIGQSLVHIWEELMRAEGYEFVLTSSLSNEQAQHFYRKNGYIDCGSLLLKDEPLEIFFRKDLN